MIQNCVKFITTWSQVSRNPKYTKKFLYTMDALWTIRVIIPKLLQKQVLHELHTGHMGLHKMKALARSYCHWKSIVFEIKNLVKSCKSCCNTQNNVSKIQSHPWDFPNKPWEKVHIDYAGPFMEYSFLIVVDAHHTANGLRSFQLNQRIPPQPSRFYGRYFHALGCHRF
jgi:hypothetical protein